MPIEKFLGRPVTVEAIQWTGKNLEEIKWFCNGLASMRSRNLYIETTEGTSRASIDDYIVRGTQGEFYPVKPNVMKTKYEKVVD